MILSLVRNSGGSEEDEANGYHSKGRVNIGFLRVSSPNHVRRRRSADSSFIHRYLSPRTEQMVRFH